MCTFFVPYGTYFVHADVYDSGADRSAVRESHGRWMGQGKAV